MVLTLFHLRIGRYFITTWYDSTEWFPRGRISRMTDNWVRAWGTKPFIKLHDFMRIYK